MKAFEETRDELRRIRPSDRRPDSPAAQNQAGLLRIRSCLGSCVGELSSHRSVIAMLGSLRIGATARSVTS